MRRSLARNRGGKDALFERNAFGQPVAVRPASSRTPRFRAIGREVMACHDRLRLAWQVSRHQGGGKNQATVANQHEADTPDTPVSALSRKAPTANVSERHCDRKSDG